MCVRERKRERERERERKSALFGTTDIGYYQEYVVVILLRRGKIKLDSIEQAS